MYQRIVSLAPSVTEIVYALGEGDNIVGATTHCNYPADAQKIPRIGSWISDHDLKQIEHLEPDLIISSIFLPEEVKKWAYREHIKFLHVNPKDLSGVYDSIRRIAELLDHEKAGEAIVNEMQEKLQAIKSKRSGKKPRVYNEEFPNPPTMAANWLPELVVIAGGIPMAKPGVASERVSPELVNDFDPELMILHWCGYGQKSDPRTVGPRKDWASIHAVKTGNIFVIDDELLNIPGPRLCEGTKALQELIETFLEG